MKVRDKRLDKIHWRVVKYDDRFYLVAPSGAVDTEGGYASKWELISRAKRLNRQLEVERLVKKGKL